MNPVKASLQYPQVTLTVLTLVVLLGVYSLLNMPRREDPKITIRTGLVVAFYPGANSLQVEEQVAKKLEQYLFQYEEVRKEKTYSTSRDGAVIINVELEEWVKDPDIFWSKLKHDLQLAKMQDLPKGVIGPIVNTDFGDTIAMLISLESDELGYSELKHYLQMAEDRLRTLKAVSKIKRYGEQPEQITVTSNSSRLAQYGIKYQQVMLVLQSQNAISATGDIKTGVNQVPLYTTGYFGTEQQIASQIVGVSPSGGVVRLSDVADIKRAYAEPTTYYTVNGHKSMMLSVEMQEGNNIVQFGKDVKAILDQLQQYLPSGVTINTIVNQPRIVQTSVNDFIREFFLAIVSVIVVTILLLPLRIAAVAAMAIPVTVAVTFAMLHMVGIELQQVSLAALIVVLGMVVDDAIVIADNYVELLDEGIDRHTAAWRSAGDLVVPVLTATATIIAAFMPMIILSGSVGEFIFSLPVTVSIALASSFVVAMLLTPYLCSRFIKTGLHKAKGKPGKPAKKSVLDYMQDGYDKALGWCMRFKGITLAVGLISVIAGGMLYFALKQKFFPAAERNQFVVELWMPTGTRLDETKTALNRLVNEIRQDKRVTSYASFAGTSAPRFYYNFSPEPPVTNFGQILVNTETNEATGEVAASLGELVTQLVPEGRPHVRLMQQGSLLLAPVEVRIVGTELQPIKEIGEQVRSLLVKTSGTDNVRTNFMEDYYGVDINLNEEGNRLGFSTATVATSTYIGFSGYPVTTMYEGDNPVNIVMRLDENNRSNFTELANTYVSSPITGASVPLRQIATITPQWETGRIVRRNGVRTLSVLSEVQDGALASEILKKVKPAIARIPLPPGYRIEYGGEEENQKETFSQMLVALGISLLLIFLILLFQFRNLRETLVVMTAIPLSLFGALLGLIITHNPFGFTSFIGLISLSGIVVRNAIILVDYTNELIAAGKDIPSAAAEAGKRRLRPIFLTAMAAAIGVLPMILSGSPMWSPLASVLAMGVLFSMVMALLVIPVLFTTVVKPHHKKVQNETAQA
ncbi:efflux RND transporter permease subunit [Deminuibacter soli]|uniref:AcrB/AcrD/AcrF family protein n=1 Tax=Deminuibacter soli TaxID=2291815 RepID=A0A3E1NFR9_9BACT|nr:efflux RND transporter permease subunit [Deminuibacter soli]RFM26809.1 AcrB/AcrD/AcrF family protein [Deminuibacter soli]